MKSLEEKIEKLEAKTIKYQRRLQALKAIKEHHDKLQKIWSSR